jgi:hypothetical protein
MIFPSAVLKFSVETVVFASPLYLLAHCLFCSHQYLLASVRGNCICLWSICPLRASSLPFFIEQTLYYYLLDLLDEDSVLFFDLYDIKCLSTLLC